MNTESFTKSDFEPESLQWEQRDYKPEPIADEGKL